MTPAVHAKQSAQPQEGKRAGGFGTAVPAPAGKRTPAGTRRARTARARRASSAPVFAGGIHAMALWLLERQG